MQYILPSLIPMLGKMRGFLMLFMPDVSLIALVSGGFSLEWSFLRTGLVLGALRKFSSPLPFLGRLGVDK